MSIEAVRKRLYEDFEYYAKHALKIRTKEGTVVPLVLNAAQKIFMGRVINQLQTTGKVRVVVLKGRQQGLSTIIEGIIYWWTSQHKAVKSIVMTHLGESTKALFDMAKRYHENCPEILRPHTKYSSRKELAFDLLDSSYMVATAGGEGIGRGETIQLAHLSEAAFYPPATAKDNINGLMQAIPNAKGTFVFVESTANGIGNPFHNIWTSAVEGKSEYEAIFIPWFVQQEYRAPVPEGFSRTPKEEELVEKFGLDDEQLMFRRHKIAVNGEEMFQQEYPCHADEAFLTSGRPVFHTQQIHGYLQKAPDIKVRMELIGERLEEAPRGDLLLYRLHDPGETYYIGADVAMGVRGGDWSVAQILDSKKRVIGIYRSQVHPDYFATVLNALGHYFNTAKIAVENNNHGILTATRLGKDLAYPNLYFETHVDKQTEDETVVYGFRTTVKTKPLIIDKLRQAFREEDIKVYDKVTLRELITYVVTDDGKMEAEPGCFDDCVMSLAIANFIHEGHFTPVESTDAFYIEMI
ncbi:hypothetical protein [Burkholderia vietnamiensis]|uniref:hypothetical protein n=1 Tax=Burkholderia vietnamiensis TaxID=60552 RepID=UPI00264DB58D|nr:hypothetical protein [Burkholderia vietnamiensis]MDN8037465.1 hypothetical protein [Burkholderia vietnamiensis]